MRVTEIIQAAKKPLFTFELVPPLKGRTLEPILETIRTLMEFDPSYINVTNHQAEVVYLEREDGLLQRKTVRKRPGTTALAALIQHTFNVPTVAHVICGGMSREQIEDTLIELHFLGIDNILALRGDPPSGEKRFIPMSDGHTYSSQLVKQIADLNHGRYLDDQYQDGEATHFSIGVAGYPEKHAEAMNMAVDLANLKKKVDAGAEYIVTQMFFDNEKYFAFVDACRAIGITVPIIPGLKPIASRRDLSLIPQTFGVDLPEELTAELEGGASNAEIAEIGVRWCIAQSKELYASGVPSIHYYTLGKAQNVARIVRAVY
jgi:methylenetetrahydrofolate reductase (NADPH)